MSQKYFLKATVEHTGSGAFSEVRVELEGSGYVGKGKAYSLSSAFEAAYQDLMAKLSTDIFTKEVL
jgi:hypothetical protein